MGGRNELSVSQYCLCLMGHRPESEGYKATQRVMEGIGFGDFAPSKNTSENFDS